MPKHVPALPTLPPSRSAYSPLVEAAGLAFVAGQVGRPTDAPPDLPFVDEARATFAAVAEVLEAAGLTMRDVVRCTVYLTDFGDFATMDGVFREVFPTEPPVRATVGVSALARDCRIEVEATAAR